MHHLKGLALVLMCLLLLSPITQAQTGTRYHAVAMHGEPAYGPEFTHFSYVNPDARKGGHLRRYAIGTYDSLNPFVLKGTSATGLGYLYDTLTHGGEDEPFTAYGLLAQSIELPDDRSWVRFHLRPEARFHDGKPVTAEDVVFSFNLLREKGVPFYRSYYANVSEAVAEDSHKVLFRFNTSDNRELALILGQLPILPKHFWQDRDFESTSLNDWPMGSGPYRIHAVDPGRSITYKRDENYWARDLPVNRGRYNFDLLSFDYYRDTTVAFQAFKAGEYDWRLENTAKIWATGYEGPALTKGLIKKEMIRHQSPQGMQAFVFNTRLNRFDDARVRQAIGLLFDFEWTNRNMFYDAYTRSQSFFANSELAASGLPSEAELEVLEKFRDQLPAELFTAEYQVPQTDGSGNIRPQIRQALALLKAAGWELKNGKMTNQDSGEQLKIEFLLYSNVFERIIQPFSRNLERVGIASEIRIVDVSQYINRLNSFDFDVVIATFSQSSSPGNEQRSFWGSEAAKTDGSRNLIGIQDPVIDELIEMVINAPDRESLVTRVRALDRVLLWRHYVIPQYHINSFRVAYWDMLERPQETPRYQLVTDAWWYSEGEAEKVKQEMQELQR